MVRPKKNKEVNKEILLDAGLEEFSIKGFYKTKLEDIAKRANVTRGAIYWHFKNKEDFYISIVRHYLGHIDDMLINILESDLSNSEKIAKCYTDYFMFLNQNEKQYKTKVLERKKIETWQNIDELQVFHDEKLVYWRERFAKLIQNGINQKEFSSNIDPNDAALNFICLVIGAEEVWIYHQHLFDLDSYLQNSINIYIEGLKTS